MASTGGVRGPSRCCRWVSRRHPGLRRDQQEPGLVFEAHPQLHRFPWAVPGTTSNCSISAATKRQAFNFHKKVLARPLGIFLDRLESRAGQDAWAPRPHPLSKATGVSADEKTLAHAFWDCPYAVSLWEKLIGHWTGKRPSRRRTHDFFDACASRRVVNIPAHRKALLTIRFPEDGEAAERMWRRIWHILATLCQTRLWADRNDAVCQAATSGHHKYHDQLLGRLHPTT
uniref:RxLR effector candidate protein n=1 Tax=Hyaloperonospora arabidopsidis (strain Emoy2) TaxID=559515 RepID=M4C378_HYAAE|nr:RxLR effector candidate protein [Hyaloperonospora arabidopsidis Emoy2]